MKRNIQQTNYYTISIQLSLYWITEIDKTEINVKGLLFLCLYAVYTLIIELRCSCSFFVWNNSLGKAVVRLSGLIKELQSNLIKTVLVEKIS